MTLQEVEAIAKEKTIFVHAGREAPEVSNPTWKLDNDENAIDALPAQAELSPPDISPPVSDESEPTVADDAEPTPAYIGHQIPEDFLKKAGLLHDGDEREDEVRPIYKLKADGSLPGELLTGSRFLDSNQINFLLQKHLLKYSKHLTCSVTRNSAVAKRRL